MRERTGRRAGRAWMALLACMLLGMWAWPAQTACAAAAGAPVPTPMPTLTTAAPKDGRTRPLVAIVADNAGTETTDFVVPYSILKASGAVDVVAVSTDAGAVELMPALRVLADATFERFDAATPAGADVVIVPALQRADSPAVLAWLRKQAAGGATYVAIREGAEEIGRAAWR
ncbi:thiamine biosynthesis protein ThiJ, partial [Pseudomonas sp. MWU13-2625]